MNSPKVSIIVPVYNVEKYIRKCIDSILCQTFADFECILVDDCSPDSSGKICDEYAEKDIRIKVIHNEKNEGSSLSRKTGLENSCGEYIQFVDSDDWIEPNMIELLYQKAVSENFDMVVCDYFMCKNDGVTIKSQKDYYCYEKHDIIKQFIAGNIHGNVWNKFVHRQLLLLADFPVYNYLEDCVITVQNLFNADKVGLINIPLYHYWYNPASIVGNKNRKAKARKKFEGSENWFVILKFLSHKYGTQLKILEPELKFMINQMKTRALFAQNLTRLKEIHEIHPVSWFYGYLFLFLINGIMKKMFRKNILLRC